MAIPVLNAGYFAQAAAARRAARENEKDRKARENEQLRGFGMDLGKTLLTQTPFAIADTIDQSNRTGIADRSQTMSEVDRGLVNDRAREFWPGKPSPQEQASVMPPEPDGEDVRSYPPEPIVVEENPWDNVAKARVGKQSMSPAEAYGKLGPLGEALQDPTFKATQVGKLLPSAEPKSQMAAAPAAPEVPAPTVTRTVNGVRTRTVRPGAASDMPDGYGGYGAEDVARRKVSGDWAQEDLLRAQAENLRKTDDERLILAEIATKEKEAAAAEAKGDWYAARRASTEADAMKKIVEANRVAKRSGQSVRGTLDKPELDSQLRFRVSDAPPTAGGRPASTAVPGDPEISVPLYVRGKGGVYQMSPRAARVPVESLLRPDFDPRTVGLKGEQLSQFKSRAAALRAELRKGGGDAPGFAAWVAETAGGNHPGMSTGLADIGDVRTTRAVKGDAAAEAERERALQARATAEEREKEARAVKDTVDAVAALQQKRDSRAGLSPAESDRLGKLTKLLEDVGVPLPAATPYPQGSRSQLQAKLEKLQSDRARLRAPTVWETEADKARYTQEVQRLNAAIDDLKAQLNGRE